MPLKNKPKNPTLPPSDAMESKPTPFSIDRTFSASSDCDFYDDEEEAAVKANPYKTSRIEYYEQFDPNEGELPNGMSISGEDNIIGNVNKFPSFDQDEEDEEEEEEENYDEENGDMNMSSIEHQNTPNHPHNSDDDNDINNDVDININKGRSGAHRKKSILRHTHDPTSASNANSFNGNVGGSSIISDGKMMMGSSMSGSFNSQFYNNFYSRAARRNDFQRYTRGPYAPLDRCNSTSASSANSSTITQHYYPEGGWGYVVLATAMFSHALLCGFLLSGGLFATKVLDRFGHELTIESVWLTSLSLGVSLLLSPLWVSICKKKSTRLTAVFGGLVASLGCLFTSFASQFHQLFFSYVIFMGIGVGLTRDASILMVGQYFKRKRDFVEILLVSGSGIGILCMPVVLEYSLSAIGWRLGLQCVTGMLVLTFFLSSCYRSASLYHPQRRAIIHLKNQKRKIKEKEKKSDGPPFLDLSCLTIRSLQILLISCAFTAWGIYSPLFHLALEGGQQGEDELAEDETDKLLVYVYIGAGWIIGSFLFGFLAIQRNEECRISKFYLCQVATLLTGISIIALTNVKDQSGLVTFSWVYGIGLGGYHSMLKILTYEKVRARLFPRAWSFVQCVQGASLLFGIPVTGYINTSGGLRRGYFLSAGSIFIGFFVMFINTVETSRLTRHKSSRSSMKTCETTDSVQSPEMRRISFTFPDEQMSPPRISKEEMSSGSERSRLSRHGSHSHNEQQMIPKELTRISEEGILDTIH